MGIKKLFAKIAQNSKRYHEDGTPLDIGEYEFSGPLYYGSRRAVAKAVHAETGRALALKHVSPNIEPDRELIRLSRESLKREAAFGEILDHPNVVKFYGLAKFEGEEYLLMEFLPGGSLLDVVRRREKYTFAQLIDYCIQAATGLAYLHRMKIVHRDLKPGNVLFEGDRAVITDFGLSECKEMKSAPPPPPRSGTPKYMSPEQTRGWRLEPASDIYSFGVMMYELFSGELRISAMEVSGRAERTHACHFEPLYTLNPLVPHDLNVLVMRCLESSRRTRVANGKDLLQALEPLRDRDFRRV